MRLNSSVAAEDAPRLSRQCVSLLAALERGPVTNVQAAVDMRILNLTARVSELRQAGHVVIATRGVQGVWVYTLVAPVQRGQLSLLR